MTQLERDIEHQIITKLNTWFNDSVELCGMARLSRAMSAAIVIRSLMYCFLLAAMSKGANKADILEIVDTNWDVLENRRKAWQS